MIALIAVAFVVGFLAARVQTWLINAAARYRRNHWTEYPGSPR